jgi:hypothetical protein
MKSKSILLAIALALVAITTAAAFAVDERHTDTKAVRGEADKTEGNGTKKPPKNNEHMKEKTSTPAEGFQLDFKELFGCMPMEEKTHMLPSETASDVSTQ